MDVERLEAGLDFPVKGRYIVIRRIGPALPGANSDRYGINEIKVYEVTNLLNYGAKIFKAPDATTSTKTADNLINNLSVRSPRNTINPIVDDQGNRASFESCFVTDDSILGPNNNNLYELTFDLGKPMMQNAVLIA